MLLDLRSADVAFIRWPSFPRLWPESPGRAFISPVRPQMKRLPSAPQPPVSMAFMAKCKCAPPLLLGCYTCPAASLYSPWSSACPRGLSAGNLPPLSIRAPWVFKAGREEVGLCPHNASVDSAYCLPVGWCKQAQRKGLVKRAIHVFDWFNLS